MSTKHSERAINKIFGDNPYVNTKGSSNKNPVFNLKVSESEKYANDKQWFKDYMNYVVPAYSTVVEDYNEMRLAYEVYNDNLEGFKKELDKFCNSMGENIGQIEEDVIPFPILHNQVNIIKGENIKRNNNFKVLLLSVKAIKDKDTQLLEALKASVEEKVKIEIEKVELQLQGATPEQIKQYEEEVRTQQSPEDLLNKEFQSEWEIFYNRGLKYCYQDQNVVMLQDETIQDVLTSDRCFVYSGWRFGKPYLEVRNTMYCGFDKSPNEMFTHKADYFWYKKPITIADVYTNYGNLLSEEELGRLGTFSIGNNYRIDKRHGLGPNSGLVFDHTAEEVFTDLSNTRGRYYEDKTVGTHQGQGVQRRYNNERLIWETHIEFKAFRRLIFITYYDEYNNEITVILPESFEIPKSAKKEKFVNKWGEMSEKYTWISENTGDEYTAEVLWIPRKYEAIRLEDDIYPIIREVPYQSTDIEQPFSSFSLSTFGAIFTNRNAKSISLLQRAIPSYFQLLYLKHVQNREISKYQGYIQSVDVDQIPQKLGMDINGDIIRDPVATWTLYRKQTGIDFYSGTQTTQGGLPPATRSPGSSGYILGTASEIYQLQQVIEMVKIEIGMAMGISPQRQASFSNNSNVSDNQQAIVQSHHITEPYFFYHSLIWKYALEDYLKNFRTYCQNLYERTGENPMFHYLLPDGTRELFEVTPKMLEMHSFGLYATNGGQDQKYLEMMLNASHAFAQNAGEGIEEVSTIIKAITTGASPEETHKLIQIQAQKQQDRAMQMEQMKLKVQEEYAQRQIENREDEQAAKLEQIRLKGEYDLEKARISASGFGADVNEDNIPDVFQQEEFQHKRNIDLQKLNLEERKLQQKDKELAQKKELETKKINKQSTKK